MTDYRQLPVRSKTASETRLFTFDFYVNTVFGSGETLSSSTVVASPTGMVNVASITTAGSFVSFYVSSGTSGQKVIITCLGTTSRGQVLTPAFELQVVGAHG